MGATATYALFDADINSFIIKEIQIPELQRGEMLVKVLYTTICRSDLYTFQGIRKEKNPTILGHEIVGVIMQMHSSTPVKDLRGRILRQGDRITWAIYASDPEDPMSKKGFPQKADNLFKYGHEQVTPERQLHGGLSTHIILRENTPVVSLLPSLPDNIAALINCAVATVAGAFRLLGPVENKILVVNGTGMLGVVACAMAQVQGALSVIAIDQDQGRLEMAKGFGADQLCLPNGDGNGFQDCMTGKNLVTYSADLLLDFSGKTAAMQTSLELLGIGGTAVWVGATYPQPPLQLNAELVVRRLLTLRGLHNYTAQDLLVAVDFMEAHASSFDFENLIKGDYPLACAHEGFQHGVTENPYRIGFKIAEQP
jgi:putative phosphonate catabolism associated alcohol dehydrogenase